MKFIDRLARLVQSKRNGVCVGLDPRLASIPQAVRDRHEIADESDLARVAACYVDFCIQIIDVVAPLVPIIKPQAAFFEALGPPGMNALYEVIAHAGGKSGDEELLVILDGKRNDIGSTAQAYAAAYLGRRSPWGADALTVSPYLGDDSLAPFADAAERNSAGIFVLVKTSNPGGGDFQDLESVSVYSGESKNAATFAAPKPLYHRVAQVVENRAAAMPGECGYGDVGAVVGATYPEQLAELRRAMPHTWFLVPGYGAQGGGAKDVAPGFDQAGLGAIVNSSRGIIFAHAREPYQSRLGDAKWQQAVEAATRDMIEELQSATRPG